MLSLRSINFNSRVVIKDLHIHVYSTLNTTTFEKGLYGIQALILYQMTSGNLSEQLEEEYSSCLCNADCAFISFQNNMRICRVCVCSDMAIWWSGVTLLNIVLFLYLTCKSNTKITNYFQIKPWCICKSETLLKLLGNWQWLHMKFYFIYNFQFH